MNALGSDPTFLWKHPKLSGLRDSVSVHQSRESLVQLVVFPWAFGGSRLRAQGRGLTFEESFLVHGLRAAKAA